MRLVSRIGRIIGLLAVAAALAACSAVKLGYSSLADLSYWWLDSYVGFDDEQATRVREDLALMRRQQDALQILRKLTGEPLPFDDARGLLRGYLARMQEPPDPAQRRYQQGLIDEGCRVFAGLHNSTNAAQRQAAARRLRVYQRDLGELAARQ